MDDKTYKECKGCLINEPNPSLDQCFFQQPNEYLYRGCPCIICLIKCICTNPCEEYDQFSKIHIDMLSAITQAGIRDKR